MKASAQTPLLELRDVSAGYGAIQILHGVSLNVNEGEIVAIIGLINHLGGEVLYQGRSLVGERPDRILGLGLAYVPQGRVVFTQMTVRENLEMGAYIERDKARFKEAMDYVFTLFPRLGERPGQLAG